MVASFTIQSVVALSMAGAGGVRRPASSMHPDSGHIGSMLWTLPGRLSVERGIREGR
jgi:hypothetical protein